MTPQKAIILMVGALGFALGVVCVQRDTAITERDEARAALLTDAGRPVVTSTCTVDIMEPNGEGATLRMLTVYEDGPCYTLHGAEGFSVCLRGEP